jgi:hypothetical protein
VEVAPEPNRCSDGSDGAAEPPVGPRQHRRAQYLIAARGMHEQRHTPAAGDPMSLKIARTAGLVDRR